MVASYQDSRLWKTAMDDRGDRLDKQRATLRDAYEKFHDNASTLAEQIRADLPDLTDHGADHFNGLWHLASKIAGESYVLNPAEAFVFGGAILLHDTGNCLAAYPGGLEAIRKSNAWRDVVAQWELKDEALAKGLPDYPLVLLEVLRQLHPQQAKNLAKSSWIHPGSGSAKYLLENEDLRNFYGPLMGEIAASHGEATHEIEQFANRKITTHACLLPADWQVDALKLAALLRVADAAHLDATRAPGFLYALTQPAEGSDPHWRFQNKIGIPEGDPKRGELIFSTGGNTFAEAENAAWWLCYDACRVADNELRAADQILREHRRDPFALRAVRGISDPAQFAHQVHTEGWHPVDTSLRISDVNRLVQNLGGEKLYGDKPYLALRELLQNAADAVRAWRALEDLGPEEGRIDVELEEKDGATWMHVTDNGIGMSSYVLTNVLLDFGKSLWGSKDLRREWPGLSGSGFQATGQFGIGFFSVFMLGEQVKVVSLRYGAAHDTCRVLEFAGGLQQRPLLREPTGEERLKRQGTRVSVRVTEDALKGLLSIYRKGIVFGKKGIESPGSDSYQFNQIVAALVPALDIEVRVREGAKAWNSCIKPNDWWNLDSNELLRRISPFDERYFYHQQDGVMLLPVKAGNGELLGRCSLSVLARGMLVVNGIYAGNTSFIGGLLIARQNIDLARTQALPIAGAREMGDWVDRQRQLLQQMNVKLSQELTGLALVLGGEVAEWPLVENLERSFNQHEFRELVSEYNELWFVLRFHGYDSKTDAAFLPEEFKLGLRLKPHCLLYGNNNWGRHHFLEANTIWPLPTSSPNKSQTVGEVIEALLTEVWGDGDTIESEEPQIIGEVNGKPVRRYVTICRKTP